MRTIAFLVGLASALAGIPAADAQELRRLFFTPEQRAALDARRKARVPDKPAAVPQVVLPVTRVNGAVRRAGGRSTVWVDGQPIPEGTPDGAQLAPRDPGASRVILPAPEGGQRRDLRVGESLDRGTGEVRDVVGGSEITVGRRPGASRK
jgi:hypothetical protein